MAEQQANINDSGIAAREAFIKQLFTGELAGKVWLLSIKR